MILETLLGLAMSAQVSAADNDLPTTITYQGKSICVYKAAGAPPIFCKKLETYVAVGEVGFLNAHTDARKVFDDFGNRTENISRHNITEMIENGSNQDGKTLAIQRGLDEFFFENGNMLGGLG